MILCSLDFSTVVLDRRVKPKGLAVMISMMSNDVHENIFTLSTPQRSIVNALLKSANSRTLPNVSSEIEF
jgi:hypothetical protein